MIVVDLKHEARTLEEVLALAEEGTVLLRRPDGLVFALFRVDDFDVEAELLKNNTEFMALLRRFSQQKGVMSLEDLRKELAV